MICIYFRCFQLLFSPFSVDLNNNLLARLADLPTPGHVFAIRCDASGLHRAVRNYSYEEVSGLINCLYFNTYLVRFCFFICSCRQHCYSSTLAVKRNWIRCRMLQFTKFPKKHKLNQQQLFNATWSRYVDIDSLHPLFQCKPKCLYTYLFVRPNSYTKTYLFVRKQSVKLIFVYIKMKHCLLSSIRCVNNV